MFPLLSETMRCFQRKIHGPDRMLCKAELKQRSDAGISFSRHKFFTNSSYYLRFVIYHLWEFAEREKKAKSNSIVQYNAINDGIQGFYAKQFFKIG